MDITTQLMWGAIIGIPILFMAKTQMNIEKLRGEIEHLKRRVKSNEVFIKANMTNIEYLEATKRDIKKHIKDFDGNTK